MTELPTIWRSTVTPGSWSYVWDYDGRLDGSWVLEKPGVSIPVAHPSLGWGIQWWDRYFHGRVEIPVGTLPGSYTLRVGATEIGEITVVAPRDSQSRVILYPGVLADDTPRIAAAMGRGNGEVRLAGGAYRIATPLTVRGTLSGHGATLVRVPDGRTYREAMLIPTPGCTIEGLSLRHTGTYDRCWFFGFGNPDQTAPVENVTLRDCTLYDGAFGRFGSCPGLLVERCEFRRAGASPVMGGCWIGCHFTGGAPEHSILCEGGNGPTAFIDCKVTDADRGVARWGNAWAENRNSLFCGIEFVGINKTPNGNELLNFEGDPSKPGVSRGLFFHLRSSNCDGTILGYNCPMKDCRFWDVSLNGGMGIGIWGQDGAIQERLQFFDCELVGGNFEFGASARDIELKRCSVNGPRARNNQGWVDTYSVPSPFIAYNAVPGVNAASIKVRASKTNLPNVSAGVTWEPAT